MVTFNIQYVLECEVDPEIVVLDGSKGVYDEMDLVFTNPEFSHCMQDWAESATVGDQFEVEDFILTRVG